MKNNGKYFESTVKNLHELWGKSFVITANEKIIDIFGVEREFDVVLRGKMGPYEVLGIVECKDYSRKIDVKIIDAFQTKANSVNASVKIIFSKQGFSSNAIKLAFKYGINLYSVWNGDVKSCNIVLKCCWKILHTEINISGLAKLVPELALGVPMNLSEVKNNNQFIITGIEDVIYRDSGDITEGTAIFKFENNFTISVDELYSGVMEWIEIKFTKKITKKYKMIEIIGSGIYDWSNKKLNLPPNSTVSTQMVHTNFRDWTDATDEIWEKRFSDMDVLLEAGNLNRTGELFMIRNYCSFIIDSN